MFNKKKIFNIIFISIAVILILITIYSLKLIGIAITNKENIVKESNTLKINTIDSANESKNAIINNVINENTLELKNTISLTEETTSFEKGNNNIISEEKILNTNCNKELNTVTEDKKENYSKVNEREIVEQQKVTNSLKFEDDDLIVTVSEIDNGAIPEDTHIKVEQIKDLKQINEIYKTLKKESEEAIASFITYDISLYDSLNNEIEPNGKVNVTLDYKNIVSIDNSEELEPKIKHIKENNQGDAMQVVDVTDNIETTKTNEVQKIEFETDSFSTFTIAYYYRPQFFGNWSNSVNVIVHYIDEMGQEIENMGYDVIGSQRDAINVYKRVGSNHTNENGNPLSSKITLSDYSALTGSDSDKFTYVEARYDMYDGDEITSIVVNDGVMEESIQYGQATANNVKQTIAFYYNDKLNDLEEFEGNTRTIDVYLIYSLGQGIEILDTIEQNGCIEATTAGKVIPANDSIKYVWYKSSDGVNFTKVNRIEVMGDLYNIYDENGPILNVALDEGADMYYKVEKYINDELEEDNVAIYHIPYHSRVVNGDMESPQVSHPDTKLSNGTDGLVWKTTASDGLVEVTKSYGYDENNNLITVSNQNLTDNLNIYHFAFSPYGTQCVELNATQSGSLYQDILSIPGSQLYWSLYHRARGTGYSTNHNETYEHNYTDTMYVLAMSTESAEKYDITTQTKVEYVLDIVKSAAAKRASGQTLTPIEEELEDAEVVTLTTTNNGLGKITFTNGVSLNVDGTTIGRNGTVNGKAYGPSTWHYYTGNFSIPSGQYLTRYFFVAGDTEARDPTIGNIINNISVSEVMPEPNPGQAHIVVQKNVVGLDNMPVNYLVPLEVTYSLYSWDNENSTYVLNETTTRNLDTEEFRAETDDDGNLLYRYYRHSYPLTIPANGKLELESAAEIASNSYEIDGYELQTHVNVKVGDEVLFDGDTKSFTKDDLSRYIINNKEIVNITFTNTYIPKLTSIKINKTSSLGDIITGVTFGISQNGTELQRITNTLDSPIFEFNNLKYNTDYVIEEIETPSSHYKMNSNIIINISEENGIIIKNTEDPEISSLVSISDSKDQLNIINLKHTTMPKTGGIGYYTFYILGILTIGLSIYIYNLRRNLV